MREYIRALVAEARWRLAVTLALTAAGGLTEGAAVVALVPVLQVIGLDAGSGTLGVFAGWAESLIGAVGVTPSLGAALLLYGIVGVSLALIARAQQLNAATLQNRFAASLRSRLYRAVARSNWLFLSRTRSSDISQVLTSEIDRVSYGTQQFVVLAGAITTTTIYLALAFRVSVPASAVAILGTVLLFPLMRRSTKAAHETGMAVSSATRALYALTIEQLHGMKTVKSYGVEDTTADRFSAQAGDVAGVNRQAGRDLANLQFAYDIGIMLVVISLLVVCVRVATLRPAEIVLLLFVFMRIAAKLSSIQQNWTRVIHMLSAFVAITDLLRRADAEAEGAADDTAPVPFTSAITLRDVSFSYASDASAWTLFRIDLTIPAGSTTAITGPSGAGKSTVADLVVGLVAPSRGEVLVDGVSLTPQMAIRWRQQLAYVGQDTFLFNDTVRANLRWARPDATDSMIIDALNLAAADFVAALPDGLDTFLGDRGVRVSGGERQRLALARAVLREPCLLVLDEATSNLDAENARRIWEAIDTLHGDLTILVISHDSEVIRHADIVHSLDHGRLQEGDLQDIPDISQVPEAAEPGKAP